jgi:branched-chain amino acid aminotransferase
MEVRSRPFSISLVSSADKRLMNLATELVTPPLGSDSVILPGVTRDSILSLAREHASGKVKLAGLPEKVTVSERNLTSKSTHR